LYGIEKELQNVHTEHPLSPTGGEVEQKLISGEVSGRGRTIIGWGPAARVAQQPKLERGFSRSKLAHPYRPGYDQLPLRISSRTSWPAGGSGGFLSTINNHGCWGSIDEFSFTHRKAAETSQTLYWDRSFPAEVLKDNIRKQQKSRKDEGRRTLEYRKVKHQPKSYLCYRCPNTQAGSTS